MNAESASPASLFDLSGRVVVVSGSARGLGKAMARGLAGAGAGVVVCSRTASEAEETARELVDSGHTAVATTVDTAERASCEQLIDFAVTTFEAIKRAVVPLGNRFIDHQRNIHRGSVFERI